MHSASSRQILFQQLSFIRYSGFQSVSQSFFLPLWMVGLMGSTNWVCSVVSSVVSLSGRGQVMRHWTNEPVNETSYLRWSWSGPSALSQQITAGISSPTERKPHRIFSKFPAVATDANCLPKGYGWWSHSAPHHVSPIDSFFIDYHWYSIFNSGFYDF